MPKLRHNTELVEVNKEKLPDNISSSLTKGITQKRILRINLVPIICLRNLMS